MDQPVSAPDLIMARLARLHPKLIDLSLGRIERLLARLGHPEHHLPPVLHVAGTNGKGSTCAFAAAIARAAGLRTHVYTSPHLVRFNERIVLADHEADDATIAEALRDAEAANGDAPITVFEIATAAAFLLFSRIPADFLVLEVGLGGRLDATNVIDRPAATAITAIGIDHQDFLGETIEAIAAEKAGILKRGVPAAIGRQSPQAASVIFARATAVGAPILARGSAWQVERTAAGLTWRDSHASLDLPAPALRGPHQLDNAGIAIAALRATADPRFSSAAIASGIASARWPARMQRLVTGPLPAMLPGAWQLWLDGGHNAAAGQAIADHLASDPGPPWHVIAGMKQGKATAAFLAPIIPHAASLHAVAEPGQHLAQAPEEIVAASGGVAQIGPRVVDAIAAITTSPRPPARILVCGSLYLAGILLRDNE